MKPVCLVIGAGAGIGGNVGRRFAREGFHAVLCRRSSQEGLDRLISMIEDDGGTVSGHLLNAVEDDTIERRVEAVEADVGPIEVAVYNLGAQIGDRSLGDTSHKAFEMGWRLGTFGLFPTGAGRLSTHGGTGPWDTVGHAATAAMRGNPGQHSHAAAMGGRRLLCQTLNAEYGPRGVHVAHIVVDGAVDAPDTLGRMLGPERYRQLRETRGDGLLRPDKVADTFWHIAQQHRSVWTHELDLRPYSDSAWWNG